jgi:imidazolonepropionase-like amidohydrolase
MVSTRLGSLIGLIAVATLFASPVEAQYTQRSLDMETTDDPRRVPIPPRDRSNDPILVVRGGTVIDGTGAAPLENAVVVIRGDRILEVGASGNVSIPSNVERTVDVSGLYVVPGLIDLHLHFTQQRGDDFSRYRDSDAAAALRGALLLGSLLDGGITAVRDVGTRNDVALKLKEAVERRMLDGPRVFWSGKMIVARSGHGDEVTSTATGRPKSLAGDARHRVATGPDEWRLAVREQFRMQADWIKITAPYTREEVAAAVDEAHMHGIRVAADAYGDYVTWGAEAGLDTLEHPLALDDDILKAMARHGTAFVPTLTAFYNVIKYGYPPAGIPAGGFYYTNSRRFPVTEENILAPVKKAHKLGIKIGVGSDIPFENEKRYPSDYFTELGLLKKAGMPDADIFASATRVGAEILDMADKLGTLEPGKLADVLVVAANPLDDIANLEEMRLVIADGRVVRDRRGGGASDE